MENKKKIVILYSTAGMGHKKAAIAVAAALEKRKQDVEFKVIDVLDYAKPFYKFLYLNFYVFLMSRGKLLWGLLYYFSNMPIVDILTREIRGILDYHGFPGLGAMLREKEPDAIIATHFLLPSIAGILKKRDKSRAKMYAVVTDYGPHSYWLSGDIDKFFVGADEVLTEMKKRGVPSGKMDVSGIPTTEEFSKDFDSGQIRGKYGLDKAKKTIFLMSGGFGVGPIGKMLFSLNSCRADIQVITICGHNKDAYDNINKLKTRLKYPVQVFGFTDKVSELMAISDIMITKAGGISVTEALNSRLVMILFASIPGQETWNEQFLMANGAALKAFKIKDLPVIADKLLLSQHTYEAVKEQIAKIRKPFAAERIVDVVMKEI
ncbi:MAG: glycosyltransferase [Candidatus Omnitrophota bacterium]